MNMKTLIAFAIFFFTPVFAAKPLFRLTQTVSPPSTIINGRTAFAYYQVTNNTPKTLKDIGVTDLPPGVVQDPAGSGLSPQGLITCRASFKLAPGASCLLKLNVIADKMNGTIHSGPKVCQNASAKYPAFCSTPKFQKDILNVKRVSTTPVNAPILTVDTANLNLTTGTLLSIVVTNTSVSETVNNVTADFSGTALANKVEIIDLNYTNDCFSVAPGASCTLYLVSYQQTAIAITNFIIVSANSNAVLASASASFLPPNLIYTSLLVDQIINADIWGTDSNPKILSANYAFEGIQGVTNGEQYVVTAGGAWNSIFTAGAPYGSYTSAGDTANMASAFGYTVYYGDAMPICFNWPVLPSTVNPTSFELTLNTGEKVFPDVASISPNFYYNELSCVVIFGKYGNRIPPGEKGAVYPTTVTIVQGSSDGPQGPSIDLKLVGPDGVPRSIVGQSIASGNPYVTGGGPGLLAAKLSVMSTAGQYTAPAFAGNTPNDGIALYGASKAQYRLRMYTSGGFSPGLVAPSPIRAVSLMPTDYTNFFLVKVVADGISYWLYKDNKTYTIPGYGNVTISGLASLGLFSLPLNDAYLADNNNYIDIVLYGDEAAMRKIVEVDIPTTGINPETGTSYLPLYNPGGPGNDPTPGIFYTMPGPPVFQTVTIAIDDANTVTYP